MKIIQMFKDAFHKKEYELIDRYVIRDGKKHPVAIICPGGGYSLVCSFVEGIPYAKKLNSMGISAVIVYYRTGKAASYYGANHAWNPYLVGLFCGASVGSCWCAGDLVSLMISESTPTNLRASIMAIQPLTSTAALLVVSVISTVLINILGDVYIGIISLCTMIPGLVIGLIILTAKAKETNGVDMGAVTGYEE